MTIPQLEAMGRNIQAARELHGLKPEELAEACSMAPASLRQLESGAMIPSLDVLLSLCDTLDTTPNALLAGSYRDDAAQRAAMALELIPEHKMEILMDMFALLSK